MGWGGLPLCSPCPAAALPAVVSAPSVHPRAGCAPAGPAWPQLSLSAWETVRFQRGGQGSVRGRGARAGGSSASAEAAPGKAGGNGAVAPAGGRRERSHCGLGCASLSGRNRSRRAARSAFPRPPSRGRLSLGDVSRRCAPLRDGGCQPADGSAQMRRIFSSLRGGRGEDRCNLCAVALDSPARSGGCAGRCRDSAGCVRPQTHKYGRRHRLTSTRTPTVHRYVQRRATKPRQGMEHLPSEDRLGVSV